MPSGKTVKKISDKYHIKLSEDEAGFIALHLVNAQGIQSQQNNTYLFTITIQDILNIVRYYYKITFDEDSVHFSIRHTYVFLTRVLDGENQKWEKFLRNCFRLFKNIRIRLVALRK